MEQHPFALRALYVLTISGCGGLLSGNTSFTSPNHPLQYPVLTSCTWNIRAIEPTKQVTLTFTKFDLEDGGESCRFDYVLVRDGDSQAASLLGKFCGNGLPNSIRSTTDRLWVQFYSDSKTTGTGFSINVEERETIQQYLPDAQPTSQDPVGESKECFHELRADVGSFHSPNYPNPYDSNTFCVWIIEPNTQNALIEVEFLYFNIESDLICGFDHLTTREGRSESDLELWKKCGKDLPPKVSGKVIRFEFYSDYAIQRRGFNATWKILKDKAENSRPDILILRATSANTTNYEDLDINFVATILTFLSACHHYQDGFNGIIRSTNYPENYPNNANCRWVLRAPLSTKIHLRFRDFDLEKSINCEYDFVQIYDGRSETSNLIGRFCSDEIPDVIESSSNEMLIIFHSDSSDSWRGFDGTWQAVDSSVIGEGSGISRRVAHDSDLCGGEFSSDSGSITSPRYPSDYPSGSSCAWHIQGSPTQEVQLMFEDFDLEPHSNCRYDHVLIKHSSNDIGKKYCGIDSPGTILSKRNELIVEFESDATTEKRGFRAKWKLQKKEKITPSECGGDLTGNTGILTSPGYPNPSENRELCTWTITSSPGSLLEVSFVEFEIADHPGCGKGYLQLKEGLKEDAVSLGTFCGYARPSPVRSSSNQMSVGYLSDGGGASKGFQLRWVARAPTERPSRGPTSPRTNTPCGSTITGNSGLIRRVSTTSARCRWYIQAGQNRRVRIAFRELSMVEDPACSEQSIIIRDGPDFTSPLLLRTCGNLKPQPVTSSADTVMIEYAGSVSQFNSEVEISWQAVSVTGGAARPDDCGLISVSASSVINGADQGPGTLPWVVGLMSMFGRVHCGGALLNSEWVLTAAHCFERFPWSILWKVRAGEYDLMTNENTEQTIGISRLYVHTDYVKDTHDHDIALARLSVPIPMTDYIKPVCLPERSSKIVAGRRCSIAGWGARKFLGQPSEPLTHVKPALASKAKCNSTAPYTGMITQNMVCAGGDGIDSCQGDGGSPLTCPSGNKNRHVVTGLASWGNGCAFPGTYGVYTDVAKHLDWIESIMGNT